MHGLQAMSAEDAARRLLDGMPTGDISCAYLYFCVEERAKIRENHPAYQAVWGPMDAAEVTRELRSRWESLDIDDTEQYQRHCSNALDDRKPLSRLLAAVSTARGIVGNVAAKRASEDELAAHLEREHRAGLPSGLSAAMRTSEAARRFMRTGHFAAARASRELFLTAAEGADSAGDDTSESEATDRASADHGSDSAED